MRWPSQWIVRAGDGCGSAWSPSDRESAFPPYSLADGPAPQGKGNAEGKRSAILGAADAELCGIVRVEGRNGDVPQPTRPATSEGKAPAQTPHPEALAARASGDSNHFHHRPRGRQKARRIAARSRWSRARNSTTAGSASSTVPTSGATAS